MARSLLCLGVPRPLLAGHSFRVTMNKTLLAVAVLATTLSSASQAQLVSVNKQDFGSCAGSSLSTFGGWVAVAAGRVCEPGSPGEGSGVGTIDWTVLDGYILGLLAGDDVIRTTRPAASGTNPRAGDDDGIEASSTPNGQGPDDNGPPGIGPHGDGPPGNGPDGDGPPGNGPDGNGPPGPPANNGNSGNSNDANDDLDDLVNQTNATPEPATLLLVASGLGGVGALVRRRNKRRNHEA